MNHYIGLVADWYDEFLADDYLDVVLYGVLVSRHEGRALELACGTGRVLVGLYEAGVVADGVDISEDMLHVCQCNVSEYYSPRLVLAPMQNFSMGRKYQSVLVTGGSFQLLTKAEDVESCLQCIREHLLPGGRLYMDVDVTEPESNSEWKIGRTATREVEGEDVEKDDVETCVYSSINTFDTQTRLNTIQARYDLSREGCHVDTVTDTIVMRVFSREEMEMLLVNAGFTILEVRPVRLFDENRESLLFTAEMG